MNAQALESKRRGRVYKHFNSFDDESKISLWPVFQQELMLKGIMNNNNDNRWKIWHDMAMSGVPPGQATQRLLTKDFVNGNVVYWDNIPPKRVAQYKQFEQQMLDGLFTGVNNHGVQVNRYTYFDVSNYRVVKGLEQ